MVVRNLELIGFKIEALGGSGDFLVFSQCLLNLKGKNKWESSRKLNSNGLDIRGQSNEFIAPEQNIAFSSKRRLIRMSATEK